MHAVQLVDPDYLAYAHDEQPATARDTRTALLHTLLAHPLTTLATPHLGHPFLALPPPS
ncbi:hypothetical protein [Micromonospora sp. RTGN7]|uniref:hypothetical protein n=1 Tax=Micromonospora sp. RTGN7 TaxID=3016526 RepID=UPI0029FEF411|nr:hypothetical protein [Micromonospora sp. RTGN7]